MSPTLNILEYSIYSYIIIITSKSDATIFYSFLSNLDICPISLNLDSIWNWFYLALHFQGNL